jgi:cytochrome c-type biogenesis protein CcmH/NrfG
MPEILLLVVGLALAGAAVLLPLRGRATVPPTADDDREAVRLRHRVALESLRDLEADRRAGSLDDASYATELADAEARAAATSAAATSAELERRSAPTVGRGARGPGRGTASVAAGLIAIALVGGALLPGTGIANETVVNERLAAVRQAEEDRQARIAELRAALAADPSDAETLSALADAHLAGTSDDDLARAAAALQVIIALEPDRADAYERILAAYLRAGRYDYARDAHAAYAERPTADPAEVAFFDGLIALRGEADGARAREAFDRFLELAPEDPRGPMIRGLRDEAARGG